ncbi:hypothetical protein NPIL_542611 [Nephila pilipes]|uniref:Uncharacterized protein n=1 Tax=Nephila pilipes TaxID=299642 RepID=A0A8X6NAB3_NEPPI|nr:hypothetical protein NPIL_542611 [Nephila pilipes]
MDPVQMESGESVSGCFQSMSLEQLKITVDTIDSTESAWAMLSQVEKLMEALPRYEYNSKDHQSNIEFQVIELRNSARYQVQYFARKDCEAKMFELNELRKDWDPQAKMPLDDGFQVVRREPPNFLVELASTSTAATRTAVKPYVASNRQANRKERPIPPITIDHIPRKDILIKQLRDLNSGRITARFQGTGIKVFPQTAQAYQQVREFIDKFKLQSFTYQLPEHKELRVVIRGLPETTPPGGIIQE